MKKQAEWNSLGALAEVPEKVTIIGAGIAAWNMAYALRRRQVACEIVAPEGPEAGFSAASGNPQAVVMPVLTAAPSPEEALLAECFEWARKHYPEAAWQPTGVLKQHFSSQSGSPADTRENAWQRAIARRLATADDNPAKTGHDLPVDVTLHPDGVLFNAAGWLDTAALDAVFSLKSLPWIRARAAIIRPHDTQPGQWSVLDANNRLLSESAAIVIANGIGMAAIQLQWRDDSGQNRQQALARHWQLSARHGQVSFVRLPAADQPRQVVMAEGYLTPPLNGLCTVGATFDHLPRSRWQQAARLGADHFHRNRDLWRHSPWWPALQRATVVGGRAGIRATTADHLPLAGPVVDPEHFMRHYADWHHGRHWQHYPPARPLPGLFVLGGLGSRGYTTAPWLAEKLAALLCGEPLPEAQRLMLKTVHPNRFLFRQMRKPPA